MKTINKKENILTDKKESENEKEHKVVRDKTGRWVKGHTGNPRGRNSSTLHSVTRKAMEAELPALIEQIKEQARNGCLKSQEMLISKLIPNRKSSDIPIGIDVAGIQPNSVQSVLEMSADVINAALKGEIEHSAGEKCLKILSEHCKILETLNVQNVQRELDELKEAIEK